MKVRASLLILVGVMSSLAFADINLSINNATGALEVSKDNSPITSLRQGTISSLIKAGNDSFRVSYGKDMNGMPAVVIYRESNMKGNVTLNSFGTKLVVAEKSAVTITLDSKNKPVAYEAGALGGVTVADVKLESRQKYNVQAASVADKKKPAIKESAPVTAVASAPATEATPVDTEKKATAGKKVPNNVVARLNGEVTGAMKYAAGGSKLVTGDVLSEGSTVVTGKSSSAVIQVLPDVLIQLNEETSVELTKVATSDNSGYNVLIDLKYGTVNFDIENGGTPNKIFTIQTPESASTAHGTSGIVRRPRGTTVTTTIVVRGIVAVRDLIRNTPPNNVQPNQKLIVGNTPAGTPTGSSNTPVAVSTEDQKDVSQTQKLTDNSGTIKQETTTIVAQNNQNSGETPGQNKQSSSDPTNTQPYIQPLLPDVRLSNTSPT